MSISDRSAARPGVLGWNISTDDTPLAEELYRSAIGDWYSVSDIARGQKFFTENRIYQFGDYVVGRGRSVGQVVVRGPGEIRRSGLDCVAVILDLAGMKGDADGRDVNTPPGSFHLRNLARPVAFRVDSIDVIVLTIPRDRAPPWLIDQNAHGSSIDGTPRISRLLTTHLMALIEAAPALSVEEGVTSIEAALVIAERAFRNTGKLSETQTETVYRALRASAVTLIDQRLHEQNLKLDWLIGALGTSRATLFRAFASSGGIGLYIRQRRLERAREALLARVGQRPTVAEIGRAHGFASESHFSRSFRDHFDHPPSLLQSTAAATPPGDQGCIRFDQVLSWMSGGGYAIHKPAAQ
jgi:AraC-like DNA-binding protein